VPSATEPLPARRSIADRIAATGGTTTGFDYLRIILSVSVLLWHCIPATYGAAAEEPIWLGPWRFVPAVILPMFFALSGFLVAGSLERNPLHRFVLLRVLRIVPALAVEIILSAFLLGLVFTTLPKLAYLTHPEFLRYFLNIVGWIHYTLPGVFLLPDGEPAVINGQLWTIPFEFECYAALAVLALLGLTRRLGLLALAVLVMAVVLTILALTVWPVAADGNVPGRMLVLSFLAGVLFFLARRHIPYSATLGWLSVVLTIALFEVPALTYAASIPLAYATLWLGLMTPPRIPFGDLSYGVYLFHFPIQTLYIHVIDPTPTLAGVLAFSLPVTAVFAWLSWTLVEKPTLDHKKSIMQMLERAAARTFKRRRIL